MSGAWGKWILVSGEPQLSDFDGWAKWMEDQHAERVVARTTVAPDVDVSTVFLGIDHRFVGDGPPILWETMIFGGKHDGYQERYSSRAAAEAGHLDAVAIAKGERAP